MFPGKDAQVKPVTFKVSCDGQHLERQEMEESTYPSLSYELQPGTKVCLTNRASMATLERTMISGEGHGQRGELPSF